MGERTLSISDYLLFPVTYIGVIYTFILYILGLITAWHLLTETSTIEDIIEEIPEEQEEPKVIPTEEQILGY